MESSECLRFLSCLHFAIIKSSYCSMILKPKQVICLEKLFLGQDVLAVLPTGYGKSLIFHVLPSLLSAKREKENPIVIVISPLNSLIYDQLSRLEECGVSASVLDIKGEAIYKVDKPEDEDTALLELGEKREAENGKILFAHPESLLTCKYGQALLRNKSYQENVCAIVVDEAHCILEWGDEFRRDYSQLRIVCAAFHDVPILALTATASAIDRQGIKKSLEIKGCSEVLASPDRPNIFYSKYFRDGEDIDSIQNILEPIAENLSKQTIDYPLTIIYLPLRWCGFAYRLFEHALGNKQYFPSGSDAVPGNRIFAQYHAPQTKRMKEEILLQLTSPQSTIRVVFATVAIGMGVDIPSVRQVIHIGPPRTIRAFFQETGRAGRDGKPSSAILHYNNRDIATNKPGIGDKIRTYCYNEDYCLRVLLLKFLDTEKPKSVNPSHLCCSVCKKNCSCDQCI